MKLAEAVATLAEATNMEELLDALIPLTVSTYSGAGSLCRCCPAAIYLSGMTELRIYVGYTAARDWDNSGNRVLLPDRLANYVQDRTSGLLNEVLK